jgi:hypothetical protein
MEPSAKETARSQASPVTASSERAWRYWLISRVVWTIVGMIAFIGMFLLFLRIAYR